MKRKPFEKEPLGRIGLPSTDYESAVIAIILKRQK